ncbi:MAG: 2-hydroxycarboxylate transporter family protein, partial [Planctomycetes bacterium]|nr:2-hydroxycarboxylate transporter family protein [Planctomycetota bacterium]
MTADLRIANLSPGIFAIAAGLLSLSLLLGVLPSGMIGALAFMMVVGGLFAFLGDHTPVVKDYLGGAPLVCVFGAAGLVYYRLLPETVADNVTSFMTGGGFLNFYIAALITGSILGMDARLLARAGLRYVFPLVGGVLCAGLVTSLVGALVYTGWRNALMYICFPIIGGGMGAGAIPMSEIVSSVSTEVDASTALSRFVPALALGNSLAILTGLASRPRA